ncbi:MAG TPA: hypothetical protein EYP59_00710 [Thiotrichaceae bacterium]|nr:hypothetical protein [Thiotrichaceae bacterium]
MPRFDAIPRVSSKHRRDASFRREEETRAETRGRDASIASLRVTTFRYISLGMTSAMRSKAERRASLNEFPNGIWERENKPLKNKESQITTKK